MAMLLLAVLTVMFWSSSRYPALNEKALMGGAIELEDPLSFEALLPVHNIDSVPLRIIYSTINWLETNRQGMTFGILFAATILTLIGYLKRKSFRGAFANSLLGLGIGAPLGVCVNCAAPIARGLYAAGSRVETTLAAMIASPTLNIVVLTMLFSLFPLYLAVAKVALSIVVILLVVPIISRWIPSSERQLLVPETIACEIVVEDFSTKTTEPLVNSLIGFGKDFTANLWFIIKKTVPLMLLAGFLGATVATLLPPDLLIDQPFNWAVLLLVGMLGLFAPVPMGFDVVLAAVLLNSGLDIAYVMTLLFTLGVFSVYSFFIVASSISIRVATWLIITIFLMGIGSGLAASVFNKWQTARALEILTSDAASVTPDNAIAAQSTEVDLSPADRDLGLRSGVENSVGIVSVEARAFNARNPLSEHKRPFTRKEAHHLGIDRAIEFSFADMWPPFWEGRSVASGDIDRDGDIDVVMASTVRGLYVYLNNGSGFFTEREVSTLHGFQDLPVFNAVLVDLDNDTWLDLFVTTYKEGNYWIPNVSGTFAFDRAVSVKNRSDANLSLAVAFADIDKDGDLDGALGNWTAGWYRRIPGEESRNRLIFNHSGVFDGSDYEDLAGMPGETLSILFTDINGDRHTDLLVANDFEQPDIFYLGDEAGNFSAITADDQRIPHSTTTTMSVKTADILNVGRPSIYLAQIAGRSSGVSERLNMQAIEKYCDTVERASDKAICQRNIDIKSWYRAGNSFDPSYAHRCAELPERDNTECKAMLVKDLAIQKNDSALCDLIPKVQLKAAQYCRAHFLPAPRYNAQQMKSEIAQIKGRNVLLSPDEGSRYLDRTLESNLDVGGWSWDVKIGDYDHDAWQDVYIVNGTWVPNEVSPSNLFYHNRSDGTFTEAAAEFGLDDYHMTAAATQFDMDGDGDLDFLTMPVNAPPKAFINNNESGHSLMLQFNDEIGNYYGIGAVVTVFAGENDQLQLSRELQLGGGFMSFDAPQLHFGLGQTTHVNRLSIDWADGSSSRINERFTSGHLYTISRVSEHANDCLLYTSPSPRDATLSRMPSSA